MCTARLFDMLGSLDPALTRFALVLPESFAPRGTRFTVEEKLRGISIVYQQIYDYRRVEVHTSVDDVD